MGIPKLGPVIAIDGPAGTGKSSVTRRMAEALGFIHVDTGALYRAVAFLTLERNREARSSPGLGTESGKSTSYSGENVSSGKIQKENDIAIESARRTHLEFRRIPGKNPVNRIFANGRDVTDFIRTPEVSMTASRISAIPEVRASLLGLQRRLGCHGKTILEGRDIGTIIFPDADLKFFLTANVEERAKRRLIELEAAGADAPSFEEVKTQILERDQGDSSRKVAPLKKAMDAIDVDTSNMTLDQVVKYMEAVARSRLGL
jgi:cytidylate kinase